MTKLMKALGAGGMAAVLGLVLFGLAGSLGAGRALADTPPNPPSRFAGSVTIDGTPAPVGTVIEARIAGSTCADPVLTFASGGQGRYVIDVFALEPGEHQNCGTPGAVITFYIGGRLARETGSWDNSHLQILDLTYLTPTPTPTATTPAGTATAVPPTPRGPNTGSGLADGGSGDASWLFALLGLGVAALGLGGVAATRRSR